MSRAELSMAAMAAALLALLGFLLFFVFLTKSTAGSQFYCQNLAPFAGRLGVGSEDFCGPLRKLETGFGAERVRNLSLFPNKNIRYLIEINGSPHSFTRELDIDSEIISSSVIVQNGNPIGYITRLDGQNFTSVATFDFTGGSQEFSVKLPRDVSVSRARMRLRGHNIPGSLDLVFVIDQSSSMNNEWLAICGSINQLEENLSRTGLGVDVQSTIYGLGSYAAQTFGSCRDDVVTNAELDAAISATGALPFPAYFPVRDPSDSFIFNIPAHDRYDEAWALGSHHVINNHPWRSNTKKILFPVSDSDPTGGGPARIRMDSNNRIVQILADATFTGNEQSAVDGADAAAQAEGVYVFPIYGDEDPSDVARVEGYRVGTGPTSCDPNTDLSCGCAPQFVATCRPVIDWMRQLTHYPQSRLAGYTNPDDLKKFAQYVLATNFPHDVVVTANGQQIFSQPGVFDDVNSPQWVDEPAFIAALDAAAASCGQPECEVPIVFSSSSEGAVVIEELEIIYQKNVHDLEFSLDGQQLLFEPFFVGEHFVQFTDEARAVMAACATPICPLTFELSTSQPAKVLLSNLSIQYRKVFLDEDVLDAVLACYERARREDFGRSFLCEELSVPPSYVFHFELNESRVTDVLIGRKWCGFFGNSDYGCGTEDLLRFEDSFTTPTNILISYDASTGQVVVR